jgi:hypothetical protein
MIELYDALAVNIHVEIFDVDMAEIIWPMSDEHEDDGVWLLKEKADKLTDDQIGRWFLNKYLIDYGNSYDFTVSRGEVKILKFKRQVKPINKECDV